MFYDRFKVLCDKKGVSCTKAAVQIGLSNATPTKWKKTGAMPDGVTLTKVADYFGITVGELLADEPEQKEKPAAQSSEPRDPLIAELISYAEGADEDGVRMLIEMAKRLKDSRRD